VPTMKTLDQVEPRTAITNLPITISHGGSYYLTQPVAQNFGLDAITITTNNVTLDLCGFTIQNTGSQTVNGIVLQSAQINAAIKNVLVKNGSIAGFSPSDGIDGNGARNCVFEDLTITGCGEAMVFQTRGTAGAVGNIIRRCRICDNGSGGVIVRSGSANIANLIYNNESLNNGSVGFNLASAGNLMINCRASGNVSNYIVAVGNRGGIYVQPATNSTSISGSSGGAGTGATDPFLNVSY
jgi:hypothetical protein